MLNLSSMFRKPSQFASAYVHQLSWVFDDDASSDDCCIQIGKLVSGDVTTNILIVIVDSN